LFEKSEYHQLNDDEKQQQTRVLLYKPTAFEPHILCQQEGKKQ